MWRARIADRLHAPPAGRRVAEHIPGRLAQLVSLAIAAAHQVEQAFVGQVGDRKFSRPKVGHRSCRHPRRVRRPRSSGPRRARQPTADVAEQIVIGRHRNAGVVRIVSDGCRHAGRHGLKAGRPSASAVAGERDVEAEADQHAAACIATSSSQHKDRTHSRSISIFKAQVFLSIELA